MKMPRGVMKPAVLVLGPAEALDGAVAAGLLGRLTDATGITGKPSLFMRWCMKGAVGGTARIMAGALLTHAGREEVPEVCGPSHKVMMAQRRAGLEDLLLTDFGAGATAAEFDAVAVRALALMGAQDSGGRAPGDAEFMRPVKKKNGTMMPTTLVLGAAEALRDAVTAGMFGRRAYTTGLAGKPSIFMRWWVEGAAGGTAHILARALLAHAGREEVAGVCGPSHKVMMAQLGAELERLLLADFGAGATAAEFDAVAVRVLALMGAEDSGGRAPGDAEFMRPAKNIFGDMGPAELVLGGSEALDGAIAAGLLERLTDPTGPAGKPSLFVRGWVDAPAGGTARI
jgi:hypothetical protein